MVPSQCDGDQSIDMESVGARFECGLRYSQGWSLSPFTQLLWSVAFSLVKNPEPEPIVMLEEINEMNFRILFTTGSFYQWDIFVVWFCLLTSLEWLNVYGIPVAFSYHKSV